MGVIHKPYWEVDTEDCGGAHWLSQYLHSLCIWPQRFIALDTSHSYGCLHRLDALSSGLIMTAKTYEAYYHLEFQFNVGTVVRDYVVLCQGCIPQEKRRAGFTLGVRMAI